MENLAPFHQLIKITEASLSEFYGQPLLYSAGDYLLKENDLQAVGLTELDNRGNLVIIPDESNEQMFVGISYHNDLIAQLIANNPLDKLSSTNLENYAIFVEEISHFHLLINRSLNLQGVSHVELEWQGEIDKLLLSAHLLKCQSGYPHILPLARQLYDQAFIIAQNHDTYWQATKYAARFWFHKIHNEPQLDNPFYCKKLRQELRQFYKCSWSEKIYKLEELKTAA